MKLFAVLILTQIVSLAYAVDYDGWLNIKLEHSLACNEKPFCPRGNILVKSLRTGTAVIDQDKLSNEQIKTLKNLAEEDGFYTIRSVVTSADNKDVEYLSSVKAKMFLESGLSDMVNVWVLPNGAVLSVNFQVNDTDVYDIINQEKQSIKTKFYLYNVEQAAVPDTASYIQKLERERDAREKGDPKDNRSFLAKYWMYIVPVVIFVMISGAANPDAGQPSR